jgi:hypothetical protein
LTDLCLDNTHFVTNIDSQESYSVEQAGQNRENRYMFMACPCLEHLRIKDATWHNPWKPRQPGGGGGPVTHAMLIKMVRRHPTPKWLRSDFSKENIAMFYQERPDITFVSE